VHMHRWLSMITCCMRTSSPLRSGAVHMTPRMLPQCQNDQNDQYASECTTCKNRQGALTNSPVVAFRFPQRYPLPRVTAKTLDFQSFQFHLSLVLSTHEH